MNDLFGNIVKRATERLVEFCPPEGYYVAYSGGKDSDVILDLVRQSGVKYDAHHNLTTCDPPEIVHHVKVQPDVVIHRPPKTMWQLIREHQMPPRRNVRYCCEDLKERGGTGRLVVTGIRWSESTARRSRNMIESCYKDTTKRYFHAIVDWSTEDVWQYIRDRQIPVCSLYHEGFQRCGCVLCPMTRNVDQQIVRWPKIARAWERAIKATWKQGGPFCSPEAYWRWWLDRDAKAIQAKDTGPTLWCPDERDEE